ncbi:MAG: sterol desaturase family protein [Deltaproteobacteria bacterium]|nr:sterol desaturase family protein [Deltaproteobacteria bacterium]
MWSVLGPVLIGVSAVVLIAIERAIPFVPGQRFWREGLLTDFVGYTLFQSYLLGLVIGHLIGWMDDVSNLSRLHLVSGWPVAVQVLFFLITHDLYIYGFHRLQHRSLLLWRVHEAHHATRDVDWLSGSRSHALEILINQTIEFAPLVLLGAAPEVALIKVTLDAIWGMYIHANIDVRSGRLQYVINGPEMHRWHHALEITTGVNFGTKFAVWDWLFGTGHLPAAPAKPAGYGLSDPFPRGYVAQQLFLFRSRR